MVREIKFRAWHKDFKSMNKLEGFRYPNELNIDVNIFNSSTIRYMKSDIILMQYTGLKDKEGKEIYEGDILCNGGTDLGVYEDDYAEGIVEYSVEEDIYSGFHMRIITAKGTKSRTECFEDFGELVVIGNIYEDKELLEEKNETTR